MVKGRWGQRDGSSHFLADLGPLMPPLSLTSSPVGEKKKEIVSTPEVA